MVRTKPLTSRRSSAAVRSGAVVALFPGGGRARVVGKRRDQPGLVRDDDGLYPVADPQLGQDTTDVRLDGRLGELERVGQLGVAQTTAEQREHPAFPGRERGWRVAYVAVSHAAEAHPRATAASYSAT
jgi:hypothetical protein